MSRNQNRNTRSVKARYIERLSKRYAVYELVGEEWGNMVKKGELLEVISIPPTLTPPDYKPIIVYNGLILTS